MLLFTHLPLVKNNTNMKKGWNYTHMPVNSSRYSGGQSASPAALNMANSWQK